MMRHRLPILSCAAFSLLALISLAFAGSTRAEPDETSSRMGKETFRAYCASCHGLEAKGDGSVAEYLKVRPADLTRISKRNEGEFPSDQVFQTIDGRKPTRGHGGRDMPVWGDAFKMTRDEPDEEAVAQKMTELVHFLQSIQEK